MSEAAGAFRPVFVVGCERSGTTLLAVLLGRHTSIAMMPESHFFHIVKRGQTDAQVDREAALRAFFANWTSASLDLNEANVRERFARQEPTYRSLLKAAMEEFAAAHGKARCGEKTPLHLQDVDTILKWFPEARVVGIVRDGRDVVLSLLEMPWTVDKRVRSVAWRWAKLLRLTRKWESAFPEKFLLVRYEDLLLAPVETMRKVDAFVGEAFEQEQLDPKVATDVVNVQTEKYKADAVKDIDPSRIAGWKKKATPLQLREMHSVIDVELENCGYEGTKIQRTFGETLARWWYRSGMFDLWEKTVAKHLPAARARRRAARQTIA